MKDLSRDPRAADSVAKAAMRVQERRLKKQAAMKRQNMTESEFDAWEVRNKRSHAVVRDWIPPPPAPLATIPLVDKQLKTSVPKPLAPQTRPRSVSAKQDPLDHDLRALGRVLQQNANATNISAHPLMKPTQAVRAASSPPRNVGPSRPRSTPPRPAHSSSSKPVQALPKQSQVPPQHSHLLPQHSRTFLQPSRAVPQSAVSAIFDSPNRFSAEDLDALGEDLFAIGNTPPRAAQPKPRLDSRSNVEPKPKVESRENTMPPEEPSAFETAVDETSDLESEVPLEHESPIRQRSPPRPRPMVQRSPPRKEPPLRAEPSRTTTRHERLPRTTVTVKEELVTRKPKATGPMSSYTPRTRERLDEVEQLAHMAETLSKAAARTRSLDDELAMIQRKIVASAGGSNGWIIRATIMMVAWLILEFIVW